MVMTTLLQCANENDCAGTANDDVDAIVDEVFEVSLVHRHRLVRRLAFLSLFRRRRARRPARRIFC